jgi:two-component system, OmpR family, heavy metal sensor histidine kinase CusS
VHSIRLSLTFYFLSLLAVALGVASWFAYRTAGQTLQEKRKATADLLQNQYDERCRDELNQVDKALLDQAQNLTRLAQFQFQVDVSRVRWLNEAGMLTACLAPCGIASVPVWLATCQRGPLPFELYGRSVSEIRLSQSDLLHHSDDQIAEYFQIDVWWGGTFRSRAMGNRSFPLNPAVLAPEGGVSWHFDDTTLEPDVPVRRVLLKASPVPVRLPPSPSQGGEPTAEARQGRRGPRRDTGARPGEFPSRPAIFVQCACDIRARDEALAGFAATRDSGLEQLDRTTDESLAGLRNRLLAVATAAFLVAVPGCLGLVRVGLVPLRRLSDAVSRVSAKDFRLPFAGPRPPRELQPIVARLREALDMLKRAFAREKQATADISHDLRTPLAALLTTTEMALRRPRSVEEYQEVLRDCQTSARQMSRAVERLLALARLDAGADTLRLQAVDAAALAKQCMTVVRPLAEARGVHLAVHVDGKQVPQLTTDPDKFSEVLTNLLHNAIQYNRPGGDIDVSLGRQNGVFELAVRDTGVGIAPDARAHLFERFWRSDPSRGADGLHAGLGLAIVKGYVDLMGGTISVESTEGQGSTFRVQLPV